MHPKNRSLYQVVIDDAVLADAMITSLMGDDTDIRKQIIKDNAKNIEILEG